MNQIATRATSSAPPTKAEPGLDATIRRLSGKVEVMGTKCSISSQSAPNHTERHLLKNRRADLTQALTKAGPSAVVQIVGPLLAWYASKPMSTEEKRGVVVMYEHALEGFPRWAIEHVVQSFNRGTMAGPTEFAPKPATLAKACSELIAPWQAEAHRIGQILEASVYHEPTEEERKRVGARFDELLGKMVPPPKPGVGTPTLDLSDEEAIRQSFREAGLTSTLIPQVDDGDGQP
jgi:hypothetical protein